MRISMRTSRPTGIFKDKWFLRTIIFCFGAAFVTFIFFILYGHGVFTVRGDFNDQAIPFTQASKEFLASGNFDGWAWNVDLGTSSIQGLGYYTLGSPFFYLIALFPAKAVPYLIGWMYMLKYTVAGCTAYLYIRRFTKKGSSACAAAILYAFTGFQTTNLIFYIFHDVVAFFPLILIGVERILEDSKDRWFLAFAIFLNAFCNYYFFVQEAIFVILYFLFRYAWKKGIKAFFKDAINTAATSILGIAMSALLFLPQILYILNNDRTYRKEGFYSLLFERENLLLVIKGFLMPGENMNNLSILFKEQWDSIAAYIPLFGLILAVAYIIKKRDALSHFLIVLMVMAFSPFLTSIFLVFTYSVQRWWLMLLLMLCLASAKVLDDSKEYPVFGAAIGVSVALVVFVIAIWIQHKQVPPTVAIFYRNRFIFYAAGAFLGYVFTGFLHKKKLLNGNVAIPFILLFAVGSTMVTLHFYRGSEAQTPAELSEKLSLVYQLDTIDEQYRYNTPDNQTTLSGGVAGTSSFSSTVANGIIEFDWLFDYYLSHMRMDINEVDGLAELLGAKYEVTDKKNGKVIQTITTKEGNTWYVTESDVCPIGFAMDSYQYLDEFSDIPVEKRGNALLSSAVIQREDADALTGYMQYKKETAAGLDSISSLTAKNSKRAVADFKRTGNGLTCSFSSDESCGLYFSVPYDKGFTAYVDGVKMRIIDSGGMMLIPVVAGDHEIELVYHTPGFKAGVIISILGWIAFAAMIVLHKRKIWVF